MSVFWFYVLEIAYVRRTGVCCSEHLITLSIYLFMHFYALQNLFLGEFGIFFGWGKRYPQTCLEYTVGDMNTGSGNCRISDKKEAESKKDKHEKIAVLAEGRLSTVSDCISKVLNDEEITKKEHSLIVSELDKFRETKEEIRANAKDVKDITKESFKQRLSQVMTTE